MPFQAPLLVRYLHLQETAASEVGAGFWASVSVWSAWFGRQADELTSLLFATPCDASVSASVSVLVSLLGKTKKRMLR